MLLFAPILKLLVILEICWFSRQQCDFFMTPIFSLHIKPVILIWSCLYNRLGGHLRDYMDRRVTPPTWGPPPPCKQALNRIILGNRNSCPIVGCVSFNWKAVKKYWKFLLHVLQILLPILNSINSFSLLRFWIAFCSCFLGHQSSLPADGYGSLSKRH